MQSDHTADFTRGKIFLPLLRFTLPILFALCLQAMYGAADLAVVGWFGSTAAVSAVSTGSQLMQTVTIVIAGLAMGTTVLLGQRLGEGRSKEAGIVVGSSLCLFFVIAVGVTLLMELFAPHLSAYLQAPPSAFDKTVSYIRICSGGMVFIIAYNMLGSIFRGLGDSRTPLLAVGISCILNIAGDLLFVAVFKMESDGAALATVISQALSVVICLFIIRSRGLPFPFSRHDLRFNRPVIAKTVKLGLPIATQDLLVSISFLAILAIVNSLGEVPSAAIGVAERLCGFIMLLPSAFMQSLSAFVAQNYGAGHFDRSRRAMLYGMLTSLAFAVPIAAAAFLRGDLLAAIFARDNLEVIAAAADYLKAYAIDTLLVSFLFCFGGYFNGCGRTRFSMLQGIAGAFAVRIPVSFLMSRLTPVSLFRVGLATPCSTIVQLIVCSVYFLTMTRHMRRDCLPEAH